MTPLGALLPYRENSSSSSSRSQPCRAEPVASVRRCLRVHVHRRMLCMKLHVVGYVVMGG